MPFSDHQLLELILLVVFAAAVYIVYCLYDILRQLLAFRRDYRRVNGLDRD
jgi:hypothetical protein